MQPRDIKQIYNVQAKLKREKFGEDQRVLLEHHALLFPEFMPEKLVHHGKLFTMCCLTHMDVHLASLIPLSNPVVLNYDTTFNCGSFYVSILSFRHPLFDEEPVIPVGFLFHESKQFEAHDLFFRNRATTIPGLNSKDCIIISDREESFKKARIAHLPHALHVFCHIHILKVRSLFLFAYNWIYIDWFLAKII